MKDLKTLVVGWLLFIWKPAYQNAFSRLPENEEHASSPEISVWKETEKKGRKSSPGHIEVETWFLKNFISKNVRQVHQNDFFFFTICSRTARSLGHWSEKNGVGIYCLVIQQEEMRSWGIYILFHISLKNARFPGLSHWLIKNYGKIGKIFPIQIYRQRPLQRKRKPLALFDFIPWAKSWFRRF